MPISAKPASYSVNTGATWCPDLLWMCSEGTGTTLTNEGKGAACTGTLAAVGTGSVPSWQTDGTHGDYIDINASSTTAATDNGGKITSSSLFGVSTACSVLVACRIPAISSAFEGALFTIADKDAGYLWDAAYLYIDWVKARANGYDSQATVDTATIGDLDGDSTWHLIAMKRQNGGLGISVDGGAFQTVVPNTDGAPTNHGWPSDWGAADQLCIGAYGVTGSTQRCSSLDVIAVAGYDDVYLTDANISTIWNSGDIWSSFGVSTATKYLKMLVHPSAASETNVAGVVFESTASGITGPKIGEFTSAAFSADLTAGQAILHVETSAFGGTSLVSGDTVFVLARNSTYTTGIISADIIEIT